MLTRRLISRHYVTCCRLISMHIDSLLAVSGIVLLILGLGALEPHSVAQAQSQMGYQAYPNYYPVTASWISPFFDDTQIRFAVGLIFELLEGAFGALIMVVAGLLAIIAAVMGGYKSALGMLVVAIGAFIMRSLVSLFFGSDFYSPVVPL